jgi:hypothetical protein
MGNLAVVKNIPYGGLVEGGLVVEDALLQGVDLVFVPLGGNGCLGLPIGNCHQPWGSVCAGAHVSCATGQESTVCLRMRLRSFLFDPLGTLFHIYHSYSHH